MAPKTKEGWIWFLRIITPSLVTGLIIISISVYNRIDTIWIKVNSQEIVNKGNEDKFKDVYNKLDLKADKSLLMYYQRLK